MLVYMVLQVVSPEHCTSYRQGVNWINSHDAEADAQAQADLYNRHVRPDVGVKYAVAGPVEETEVPEFFQKSLNSGLTFNRYLQY
jgi:hypothetical protein